MCLITIVSASCQPAPQQYLLIFLRQLADLRMASRNESWYYTILDFRFWILDWERRTLTECQSFMCYIYFLNWY